MIISLENAENYRKIAKSPRLKPWGGCQYYTDTGTSKAQLLGVIKQFDNLVSNGNDAGKAFRSVADLYGKVDEVKNELSVMRSIIGDTK